MMVETEKIDGLVQATRKPMRRFSHWTPRYIVDRLLEILYRRRHPDHPWLTPHGVFALDSLLRPTDVGIEYGSGRSTVWIARRVRFLTSVEHNEAWFKHVSTSLKSEGRDNVDYRYVATKGVQDENNIELYLQALNEQQDESLDFVLVDGVLRGACAWAAIPKLRSSGLLIIDNANWFLPCNSRAPKSRSIADGPDPNLDWPRVHDTIKAWRVLWTSSGVTDTAIFFKP